MYNRHIDKTRVQALTLYLFNYYCVLMTTTCMLKDYCLPICVLLLF